MSASKEIPLLDMSNWEAGSVANKVQFGKDLVASFKNHGAAKIVNYGISESKLLDIFEFSRKFFKLDEKSKQVAAHPAAPNPHRGYSFVGQENTSGLSRYKNTDQTPKRFFDIKETFDLGSANDKIFPNIWPHEKDLPGFREFLETYYQLCNKVHIRLLKALAVGLDIDEMCLVNMHKGYDSEMRLLHYPAIEAETLNADNTMRISEHTDFGSCTLLFEDGTGGLELEDAHRGVFRPVEAPIPAMLVILGDSTKRWTNNILSSVWHRVTTPEKLKGSKGVIIPERYSLAYFGKPDRSASLRPLDAFVTKTYPAMYEDMTAGQYQQSKLSVTYDS